MKKPILIVALLLCLQTQAVAQEVRTRPNSAIDPDKIDMPDSPEWDTPPKLIKGKSPVFPISLLLSGQSGKVVIQYTIGADGKAKDFTVEIAPNQKFADHAIIALKEWVFRPAMKAGVAVEARVQQGFAFDSR